jgi:hypothetical protein
LRTPGKIHGGGVLLSSRKIQRGEGNWEITGGKSRGGVAYSISSTRKIQKIQRRGAVN